MTAHRILIVGAGPAGTRAAETLVAHGLRPVVVDEGQESGGQIYRREPPAFSRKGRDLYGFEALKAARMHRVFDALKERIDYRPATLVWNLSRDDAWLAGPRGPERLSYDAILLASGAMDRVIPFAGWTLPGVYTLGGAQVALKYQACLVGKRTLFMGTGPLLYLVAYQYARHGGEVRGVLDTARLGQGIAALPKLASGGRTLLKGLYYHARLHSRGVPMRSGILPLAAEGGAALEGFRYRDAKGRERRIACDALAFGFGLRSETQLADLLGCDFRFDPLNRQWLPEIDADGRASVERVYLAGDGAGATGADAAELRGELAALALVKDHGGEVDERHMARLRRGLSRLTRFREGLEAAFPFPRHLAGGISDETILCRCEAVRAGELRAAARELGADEINRIKAFTRLGMGRCQGRVCGAAAVEVLAHCLGREVSALGRLRGQAPVKPLSIAQATAPEEAGGSEKAA